MTDHGHSYDLVAMPPNDVGRKGATSTHLVLAGRVAVHTGWHDTYDGGGDGDEDEGWLPEDFGYLDTDQSGYLELGELDVMARPEIPESRKQAMSRLMLALDTNGDGKVDVDEYLDALQAGP